MRLAVHFCLNTASIAVTKGVFVRRVCGAFSYVPMAIWELPFKDLCKNACKSASSFCGQSLSARVCQPLCSAYRRSETKLWKVPSNLSPEIAQLLRNSPAWKRAKLSSWNLTLNQMLGLRGTESATLASLLGHFESD